MKARPAIIVIREGVRVIKKIQIFFMVIILISVAFAREEKFRINYISAENVYIEAGTENGIRVGDRLTVRQNGEIIAELEVVYTARESSSCRIIKKEHVLRIGDFAISDKVAEADSPESILAMRRSRTIRAPKGRHENNRPIKIDGSISLQWYRFKDLSASKRDFSQPALRVALRGRRLWGGDFTIYIRFRSKYNQRQRHYNSIIPANEWRNRLYEFSLSYNPEKAFFQYRIGRINSARFGGVGYIDGMSLQINTAKGLYLGVFAGTQPEWQYSGFQTSIQKYGFFASYSRGRFGGRRFASTLSAVGAYHGSIVSRKFMYWQNTYNAGRTLSFYQSLEIDFNQGWRKNRTKETVSLTGLYFSSRYRPFKWLSAGLSYDNRKNYFTYEMRSLADSLFNAAFRQGVRTHVAVRLPRNYRISANFGLRTRQFDKQYLYSYGLVVQKYPFLQRGISISGRFSGFANSFTQGYNPSLRLGKIFDHGHALYLSYGNYWYRLNSINTTRINQWLRLSGQLELPKSLFFSAQYKYDWGTDVLGHHYLVELGYRF